MSLRCGADDGDDADISGEVRAGVRVEGGCLARTGVEAEVGVVALAGDSARAGGDARTRGGDDCVCDYVGRGSP